MSVTASLMAIPAHAMGSYRAPSARGSIVSEISSGDSRSNEDSRNQDRYIPGNACFTGDIDGDMRPEIIEEKVTGGRRRLLAHFFSGELQEKKRVYLDFEELDDPRWAFKGLYREKRGGNESFLLFQSKDREEILFKRLQGVHPGESVLVNDALKGRDIVGLCDYYGRQGTDLIVSSEEGSLDVLIMEKLKAREEKRYPPSSEPSPGWKIVGAERFHPPSLTGPLGRAYGDIVSQHDDGTQKISLFEGTTLESEHVICPGDFTCGEQIIAVGDMNADGQGDIIVRKKNGIVYTALMEGLRIKDTIPLLAPGKEK
jgi:hypothetical protein